jgi:hypothetical protein
MKWLERTGGLRRKELEKSRSEFHDHFEMIDKSSPECAIAARVEFGTLTRKVRPLPSFSVAAYLQRLQDRNRVRHRRANRGKRPD